MKRLRTMLVLLYIFRRILRLILLLTIVTTCYDKTWNTLTLTFILLLSLGQGSTYVRWGRTVCDALDTELVYRGNWIKNCILISNFTEIYMSALLISGFFKFLKNTYQTHIHIFWLVNWQICTYSLTIVAFSNSFQENISFFHIWFIKSVRRKFVSVFKSFFFSIFPVI